MPTENLSLYLAFIRAGIMMAPMAATVAGDEPEMAAKKAQAAVAAIARPPGHAAEEGGRHPDQPLGDAAGGHDVAGEDEERDRHQREGVGRVEHLLDDDQHRDVREKEERQHDRRGDRDGDRRPGGEGPARMTKTAAVMAHLRRCALFDMSSAPCGSSPGGEKFHDVVDEVDDANESPTGMAM